MIMIIMTISNNHNHNTDVNNDNNNSNNNTNNDKHSNSTRQNPRALDFAPEELKAEINAINIMLYDTIPYYTIL